jgi:hypothetical protein
MADTAPTGFQFIRTRDAQLVQLPAQARVPYHLCIHGPSRRYGRSQLAMSTRSSCTTGVVFTGSGITSSTNLAPYRWAAASSFPLLLINS